MRDFPYQKFNLMNFTNAEIKVMDLLTKNDFEIEPVAEKLNMTKQNAANHLRRAGNKMGLKGSHIGVKKDYKFMRKEIVMRFFTLCTQPTQIREGVVQ